MARLPAIRVSYQNDANYLLRLVDAMERDTKRDLAWRKRVITMTRDLALEFINAPAPMDPTIGKDEGKGKGKKVAKR